MHDVQNDASHSQGIAPTLALMVLAAVFLLPGLGERDFWTRSQGRPPLVARDILETGRLRPPFLLGAPYLNKPPLFHGLVALSFRLTGSEDEYAARLPALLAALLTIALTQRLGFLAGGRRAGFLGGLLLLLSLRFFTLARASQLETMLAAMTALMFVGLLEHQRRRGVVPLLLAGLGAAGATMTKGPVLALLFPAVFLTAFAVHRRSLRVFLSRAAGVIPPAALAVTAAWYLPLLLDDQMRERLLERAAFGNVAHERPFFYYLPQVLAGLSPGLLLLPMVRIDQRRLGPARPFLLAFLIGLVVFSLSKSKQSHYILPLYPLWAVAGGLLLAHPQGILRSRYAFGLCLALAALLLIALPLGPRLHPPLGTLEGWPFFCGGAAFLFLAAALLVRHVGRRRTSGPPRMLDLVAPAVALLALLLGAVLIGDRLRNPRASPRQAMEAMRTLSAGRPLISLERHPAAIFYLRRRVQGFPETPALARSVLDRRPETLLLLDLGEGDAMPPELADLVPRARCRNPDSRRGWVLLERP